MRRVAGGEGKGAAEQKEEGNQGESFNGLNLEFRISNSGFPSPESRIPNPQMSKHETRNTSWCREESNRETGSHGLCPAVSFEKSDPLGIECWLDMNLCVCLSFSFSMNVSLFQSMHFYGSIYPSLAISNGRLSLSLFLSVSFSLSFSIRNLLPSTLNYTTSTPTPIPLPESDLRNLNLRNLNLQP